MVIPHSGAKFSGVAHGLGGSGRPAVRSSGSKDVEKWANARRVEDGEADKPAIGCCVRSSTGQSVSIPRPRSQEDDHDDKHDQQWTFHMSSLV